MSINFPELQQIYNNQIDLLLSSTGLTTRCLLNYGISKKNICPNCIYDPNLKKSANKYKAGGPRSFPNGMICPYCKGAGYYGSQQIDEVYLAVIWSFKDWIIKPINIENPSGMIQTISSRDVYSKFKKCKDMTVIFSENTSNPLFRLFEDPNPAGLGDNNYLITNWERIGVSSISTDIPAA